jgi:hypothetical protein
MLFMSVNAEFCVEDKADLLGIAPHYAALHSFDQTAFMQEI